MLKDRKICVQLIGSTPGCGRSNSGSIPGILPNIVHKVKTPGRSTGTQSFKKEKKYAAGHNFAAGQKDRKENKGCEQKDASGQNHKYGTYKTS